jgi:hypothetical protein
MSEASKYDSDLFPWSCPYSFEQVVDDGFWPERG